MTKLNSLGLQAPTKQDLKDVDKSLKTFGKVHGQLIPNLYQLEFLDYTKSPLLTSSEMSERYDIFVHTYITKLIDEYTWRHGQKKGITLRRISQ